MSKIKVAMVEDDKDWAKAMALFLQKYEDIEMVGMVHTRVDSINLIKDNELDVVLMDITLNGDFSDGIYAVLDILQIKPVKIIMLSGLKDVEVIKNAFTAGAVDYVLKENFYDLPFIIRRVYSRNTPAEILVREFQKMKRESQVKDLTISEKEVFGYLEQGYSISQIEKQIYKAKNTIKQQVRSILKKLNVKSSKDAVLKVNTGGIFEGRERVSSKEKNPSSKVD